MFINSKEIPTNKEISADLCIIGAGAAGISIAREFNNSNTKVIILESGGYEYEEDTQSLYDGKNIGRDYYTLDTCRLRYLGGTTNHWGGACKTLDDVDFEEHDWLPHSGWPISKTDLDPFYERALNVCQIGPYTFDAKDWQNPSPPIPLQSSRAINTVFQFSPPVRFGEDYRQELKQSNNIDVYLYANVIDFDTTESASQIKRAKVSSLTENTFWVKAKHFVLATGGIENARILLYANTTAKNGLGNDHDLVGRFFTEHIEIYTGIYLPSKANLPGKFYAHQTINNRNIRGAIALNPQTVRSEKLLSTGAFLTPYQPPGLSSFTEIIDDLSDGKWPDAFLYHLNNVVSHLDKLAPYTYEQITSENDVRMFSLHNRSAQSPNPESRVTLSSIDKDKLGKPKANLRWQLANRDKLSLIRAQEIFAEEIGRASLGRIKIELDKEEIEWPSNLRGGYHHMGTTRMHDNPKKGVVDRNCKVHGINNLHIAGSSVFPTVGYVNPTFTIVALALRLADQLKLEYYRG